MHNFFFTLAYFRKSCLLVIRFFILMCTLHSVYYTYSLGLPMVAGILKRNEGKASSNFRCGFSQCLDVDFRNVSFCVGLFVFLIETNEVL